MKKSRKPLLATALATLLLCGCSTSPVLPGAVVEAPQAKQPPMPRLVQDQPMFPPGYWRQRLRNSLEGIETP